MPLARCQGSWSLSVKCHAPATHRNTYHDTGHSGTVLCAAHAVSAKRRMPSWNIQPLTEES